MIPAHPRQTSVQPINSRAQVTGSRSKKLRGSGFDIPANERQAVNSRKLTPARASHFRPA
jgi:hypothetical protein